MSIDIHTLSGAYAVDALDDDERAAFERHLMACEACRTEVQDLREAAATLAETVATPPSEALRARVLADIGTVRPLAPVAAGRRRARRRSPLRRLPVLVAAAAAVLVVVAGGVVWHPWQQSQQTSVADQVIHAPDVQRIRGTMTDGTVLTAYRSASLDRAAILAPDLAPAPAGRVYQLWLQDAAGDLRPAGLLSAGRSSAYVLSGDAASARGIGITIEPAGGSPKPTTTPLALLRLPAAVGRT